MDARVALALVCALGGCSKEPAATLGGPTASLSHRAPGEVLVDLSARGEALVGRPLPVPENSDADRALALRWLTRQGARPWAFGHTPALEARFVPGSAAVLVLTTEHHLVRVDGPGSTVVTLDRAVHGPLSLDEAGHRVVYTRGEPPELEVVRAELATGALTVLAPGLSPSWCPALSADGREVLLVASPEGTPAFYRVREGEAPARWVLPSDTPLPTGPTAPVLFGDAVVYESDGALCTLGLNGARRGCLPGLGLPVRPPGAATLLAQDAHHGLRALRPGDLEAPP